MASSVETLILEIIARDKNASAAFDQLRRSIDGSSTAVDKNTQSLSKNTQAQTSAIGAAIGVGTAFSAMTSPIASAGAGVIAYGTIAAPTILKVKAALTGPGGLAAAWGTLDNRQRNMASGIEALSGRYHALSLAMEPRVAQTFGTALGIVNGALGPFGQLAGTAGTALERFLIQFDRQAGLNQFITFMSHEAGPAISLLGTDITNISHAVFTLLESWGGIGLAELKAVTAVIGGITGSLSWLAEHVPAVTGIGVAIAGVALALSKLGLLGGALRLTGLATAASQVALITTKVEGLTLAEKGLASSEAAVRAITPFGWAVIAATAVGALAFALDKADKAEQDLINTTAKQTQAQGFNTAGYTAAAKQLDAVTGAMTRQFLTVAHGRGDVNGLGTAYRDLSQQSAKWTQGVQQQNQFLMTLEHQYGLTRDQAVALAKASGVQVDKNGQLVDGFKASVTQADAFANANRNAKQPVMGLAAAVTALTTDLDKQVTAVLTLQGDQLAWRSAMQQANKQLDSNSAGLKGNSANAIANKQAVLGTTTAAIAFAKEQLTSRDNLSGASRQIQDQIKWLRGLHDQSGFTKDEIKALVGWLKQVKSEQATIKVSGTGSYSIIQGSPIKGPHVALGGLITGGVAGRDSVPILAMPGEVVIPTDMVARGAVDHLRGSLPGFAAGGVVGNYRDGAAGLTGFLRTENAATMKAIENATAMAVFSAIRAAQAPAFGSNGGGVSQWAPVILAALQMLGQSSGWLGAVESRMGRESGGNPTIVNKWDSNWLAGTPSVGLMQVIGPTYAAYSGPFRGQGPFEYGVSVSPLANIYAGLNYAIHRYGSLGVMTAPGGYDDGGWLPPGVSVAVNGTGRPERVGGGAGTVINIQHLHVTADDAATLVRTLQEYAGNNGGIKLKIRS
jgi:SLT domain-containing protein